MEKVIEKYEYLQQICRDVNVCTSIISNNQIIFFENISVVVKFDYPEFCFHNLVSWLYILYHENSSRNIEFIKKKITAYNISVSEDGINSKKTVHAFRTIFQHNMDYENSKPDLEKRNICNFWYYETLKNNEPTNQNDWMLCVIRLIDSVIDMLEAVLNCINLIKDSEHKSIVLDEWMKLVFRAYKPYDFELVLTKVLINHGLDGYFNTNTLVKKNIENWRRDLDVLPEGFDFDVSCYKIVERFIVKRDVIPIDGNDLISMGVEKGQKLTDLLHKAKELFYNNPCNKEELLLSVIKYQ